VESALRQAWSKLNKTRREPFIKIAQEQNEKNIAAFQETQQQMSKSKSNGPPPTSQVRDDGCDVGFRASTPNLFTSAYGETPLGRKSKKQLKNALRKRSFLVFLSRMLYLF